MPSVMKLLQIFIAAAVVGSVLWQVQECNAPVVDLPPLYAAGPGGCDEGRAGDDAIPVSVPPMDRALDGGPSLQKDYRCMLVLGDSLGMTWGVKPGYPQYLQAILAEAGYTGVVKSVLRPGQGVTDWIKNGLVTDAVSWAENCTGAVVQLGVNDAHRQVSVAAYIGAMKALVGGLRRGRGSSFLITIVTIMPCTVFPEFTTTWIQQANLGLAEIAWMYSARVADTHWALLQEANRLGGGDQAWEAIQDDDACHHTPYGKHFIAVVLAATMMRREAVYFMSITCGGPYQWLGHWVEPHWVNDSACSTNPRVYIQLRNASELFFGTLPVNVSINLPWVNAYGRLIPGSYYSNIMLASNETLTAKMGFPLGGPPNPIHLPASSRSFTIAFRKAYPKRTNYGNKHLFHRQRVTGPTQAYSFNVTESLAKAVSLKNAFPELM